MHTPSPSPAEEAKHLLTMSGSAMEATKLLSIQFTVIQSRTQLLLTIATILLSITGFSGPRVAHSGVTARTTMLIGLVWVLSGVLLALVGSLRIRFLTQFTNPDPLERLAGIIAYRNRKTRLFMIELGLVMLGLGCFVAALIAYLLSPAAATGT